MLGIGRPDRHALLRVTARETRCAVTAAPSRASRFVLRRILVVVPRSGKGPFPIRFADLGHRAFETDVLLNSRPIFRADRFGSCLCTRHLDLVQQIVLGSSEKLHLRDELGRTQCTRLSTSSDPKRALHGGGGIQRHFLSVASGCRRRHRRRSSAVLMPLPTRPA